MIAAAQLDSARTPLAVAVAAALLLALSACVPNATSDAATTKLSVDSTGTECAVSADSAPAGSIAFSVTNSSEGETEFYFLGEDGKIVSEVEHLGPDTTRSMVVAAKAGAYFTACKNGAGDIVGKKAFTVTD
jgi:iron uptake system component EfeO